MPWLPADLTITERSRKFYNGTYKCDADGFTDDRGVYRRYDCYDPKARAPTPLPPMFLGNGEDDDISEDAIEDPVAVYNTDNTPKPVNATSFELETPCPKSNSDKASTLAPRTAEEIRQSAMTFIANLEQSNTTQQSTPSPDVPGREKDNFVSKPASVVAASKQAGTGLFLDESRKLSGDPFLAKEDMSNVKMPDTPPKSPNKTMFGVQTTSPSSTTSTLSPVPSSLSDYGKDTGLRIHSAPTTALSTPSLPSTPSKASSRPKSKPTTTRGVAQKVTKGFKKTSGSMSSPSKRKDNSVEDFTLLELHPTAFMRKGGQRRSVRQARSEGN